MAKKEKIVPESKVTLSSIEKKNNFSVPDNYFNDLAKNVQKKVSPEKNVSNIVKLKWITSIAAAFVIMFSIFHYYTIEHSASIITNDDIALYIEWEGFHNLGYELTDIAYNSEEEPTIESNITNEEIIDYLLYENTDLESYYY